MACVVSIGAQDFGEIRESGAFYMDKTGFIRDWWETGSTTTLVCRPQRFGKTLALSTVEHFLSTRFAGRGEELFGGLEIWEDARMRELQGTVPVVMVSFADVKGSSLEEAVSGMKRALCEAIKPHDYLQESPTMSKWDRTFLARISDDMDDLTATSCLGQLCTMLRGHWGVRPVVLLDDYDTPMQEACLNGYQKDLGNFYSTFLISSFKTNIDLQRALITSVTYVASKSAFGDQNNWHISSVTDRAYEQSFGFTQDELDAALDEFGLTSAREEVLAWCGGFTFGGVTGMLNPSSVARYLDSRSLEACPMNTSTTKLVSAIVRSADEYEKQNLETVLAGGSVVERARGLAIAQELRRGFGAVWSLLLAAGYVKVTGRSREPKAYFDMLSLELTNLEVRSGFDDMVRGWFADGSSSYDGFTRALLAGDASAATRCLNDVTLACMSSFDAAGTAGWRGQPERFWHGLVLGLLVELRGRYSVKSNCESGYGRCDVMLEPLDGLGGGGPDGTGSASDPGIVIEFKVIDERRGEHDLADTVASALSQIRERGYAAALAERGFPPERIRTYGIAFHGKEVLVG